MATAAAPSVAEIWKEALRYRRILDKKAEALHKTVGNGNENAYFGTLDEALSAFRLGSVATVFNDFNFATEKKVDKQLWQAHALINNKYRSVLAVLGSKTDPKVVLHRQVERKYGKFLRTSQSFYKGYLQRLSKRYPIPELERVAHSIKTEDAAQVEVAPDRDADINAKVLVSCHATLLHLGDLSRYRGQVERKTHTFDKPLAYYSLANDLIPNSGYGHHQMAVVFLGEKDKDLAAVYHLYRALAVQEPHPNALQNLEVEFKKLRPSSPPRGRNASLDPQVTLATWFVKLQAIFYTGETLPQQAELEGEVAHRMQMLLVTKDSNEVLMMMTLTNITAYYIARQRAEKKWSVELSQSCQFMLSFNIRMILAVSRVVMKEIKGALEAMPGEEPESASASTKETDRFLAVMTTGVPILRIFMIWICLHRADLVKYADHLPHLVEAHASLAETISLLIEAFRDEDLGISTAEYLLREDIETIGFEPLRNEAAPFVCRAMHYTLDGKQKQRLESDISKKLQDNVETLSRINDIINCGYFLATDPNYPLQLTQTQKGSKVLTTLTVAVGGGNDSHVQGSKRGTIATFATQPVTPQKPSAPTTPALHQAVRDSPKQEVEMANTNVPMQESCLAVEAEESTAVDFGVDGETLDRVNEFLMPPEVGSPKSPVMDETSYGMHSTTANEIFGALEPPATTPTSASKKAFPGLPWDLIYTPTPLRTSGNAAAGSPILAPPIVDFGQQYPSAIAVSPSEQVPMAAGLGAPVRQAQQALRNQVPSRQQSITEPGRHEMYDHERMEEVAKAATWKVDQRHHQTLVPTPRIPASNSLQSLSSLSNHSPAGATRQHRSSSYTATPFFQSSNFSPGPSGLPPINSPWGLPPAARVAHVSQNNRTPTAPKWTESSIWGSEPVGSNGQAQSQAFYGSMKPSEDPSSTFEQDPTLLQAMANQTTAQAAGKL
ncbi:hypothetical protein RB601_001642 [Gaeumannomyces tritici]